MQTTESKDQKDRLGHSWVTFCLCICYLCQFVESYLDAPVPNSVQDESKTRTFEVDKAALTAIFAYIEHRPVQRIKTKKEQKVDLTATCNLTEQW